MLSVPGSNPKYGIMKMENLQGKIMQKMQVQNSTFYSWWISVITVALDYNSVKQAKIMTILFFNFPRTQLSAYCTRETEVLLLIFFFY